MNKWILISLLLVSMQAYAEKVDTLVEFFSFGCQHCYQSEGQVKQTISLNNSKYVPVLMVQDVNQQAVSSIYTACQLKGLGWKFRDNYFNAVFQEGYPDYSPVTVSYVLKKIGANSNEILKLAQSTKVQEKMSFDMQLIKQFHVSSTPTFIINGDVILEGETALSRYLTQ